MSFKLFLTHVVKAFTKALQSQPASFSDILIILLEFLTTLREQGEP